jgi:hypothetical protein
MTIGLAIIIAAVLFLIDRNHVWPQVWNITKRTLKVGLKCAAVVFIAALVCYGIFSVWGAWNAHKEALQEAKQQLALQRDIDANQTKFEQTCKDWESKHPIGIALDKMDVKPDNGGAGIKDAVLGAPQGCEGPLETDYNNRALTYSWHEVQKPESSARHLKFTCEYGSDRLTSTKFGDLKSGEVHLNDIVTLLENDGFGHVKVRTASGQIGWAADHCFEIVQ